MQGNSISTKTLKKHKMTVQTQKLQKNEVLINQISIRIKIFNNNVLFSLTMFILIN